MILLCFFLLVPALLCACACRIKHPSSTSAGSLHPRRQYYSQADRKNSAVCVHRYVADSAIPRFHGFPGHR
ncbi:hypothetical protein BDN71DRAFT_1444559 [Pleurotus eryngii]|uniref:Secreted protein n=1 Tax=Pleurotus eryngii TaxID=5323 RepID=A0A9P6A2M8_PLEER|nr:hypothetical protein BDN71DRAFT_1444559 [Pleurotus eryngii]